MRHGSRLSVAATCLALASASASPAHAQLAPAGPLLPYLGGEVGWTSLTKEFARAVIPTIGPRSHDISWNDGFNGGARVGVEIAPWRAEGEFRYQSNDVHKFANAGANGDYHAAAALVNLIYDFEPGWIVSPHIGGGIGVVNLDSTLNVHGLGQVITGSDWVVGYQAIGGISYLVGPTMLLELDYRYLGTDKPHFRTGANFVDGSIPAPHIPVTSGYASHSFVTSLIVRFGVPAGR